MCTASHARWSLSASVTNLVAAANVALSAVESLVRLLHVTIEASARNSALHTQRDPVANSGSSSYVLNTRPTVLTERPQSAGLRASHPLTTNLPENV